MARDDFDALQTSATDPDQIAHASRKVKDEAAVSRARWRHQLSSKEGREFLWEEIFRVLFEYVGSTDLQKLGVRNEELRRWVQANEHGDLFLQMQNEAMVRRKRRRIENQASRTKRATEQTT